MNRLHCYITIRLPGWWRRQWCKYGIMTPPPPKPISTTTTTTRSDGTGIRTRKNIIITRLRLRRNASHRLGRAPRSSPGAVCAAAATTAIYCDTDSAALLLRTVPHSDIYTIDMSSLHTRVLPGPQSTFVDTWSSIPPHLAPLRLPPPETLLLS